MRIQHNIPAMNAYRNYNTNVKSLQANLQKLSSGYKINKAGDDAAGLAISEKMRAQISGLEVAQKNAKDGISLVQTAEGAMTEIHTMLNRMFSLAEQSANGTYADKVDREQLNNEFEKLTEEIDRIAQATNFNGKKLLDGSLDADPPAGGTTTAGPVTAATATPSVTTNGITGSTVTFDANATDEQKKALNDALAAGGIKVSSKSATDSVAMNTVGGTITIAAAGGGAYAPTGFTVKYEDDSGAENTLTAGAITVTPSTGTPTGGQLKGSATASSLKLNFYDGATKVGSVDLAMNHTQVTNGTTGVDTTITFTAPAATAAANAPATAAAAAAGNATFEGDATALAKFGIESIDFNGLQVGDGDAVKAEYDGTAKKLTVTIGTETFEADFAAMDTAATGSGDSTAIAGQELTLNSTTAGSTNAIKVKFDATAGNVKVGNNQTTDIAKGAAETIGTAKAQATASGDGTPENPKALRLRVGDSTETYDNIYVSVKSFRKDKLSAEDGTTLDSLDVLNPDNADKAMNALKDMINYVSTERGELGATQNRLDHTINNLSAMQENMQDAESTIRDVDVAEEMMKYTKNNILVQSAQAMLAQANQLPQGVLQLLG